MNARQSHFGVGTICHEQCLEVSLVRTSPAVLQMGTGLRMSAAWILRWHIASRTHCYVVCRTPLSRRKRLAFLGPSDAPFPSRLQAWSSSTIVVLLPPRGCLVTRAERPPSVPAGRPQGFLPGSDQVPPYVERLPIRWH